MYASGQYFLTELMFSGEIMQGLMAKLEPFIAATGAEGKIIGTVVIGTVSGDIHDIGKNIVVNLLRSHRFKVIDLGVDVPAEKFVEMVQTSGAKVVGLSALLNSTYPEMKNVVEAFKEAGLRDQVKVIIGGTVVSEAVREFTEPMPMLLMPSRVLNTVKAFTKLKNKDFTVLNVFVLAPFLFVLLYRFLQLCYNEAVIWRRR